MDEHMARLTRRVWALEKEVAEMRSHLGLEAQAEEQVGPAHGMPLGQHDIVPPVVERSEDRLHDEVNIVGTWLARVGAIAILIGAGFAFRWGVERGVIVPFARALIGLAAGAASIGWGIWARRRGWDRFAQAVTAGGLALGYLSVFASYELYHLVPGSVAFAGLVGVAVVGGFLARAYDSMSLAVLSLIGAYLNPFLVSVHEPHPFATFGYLAAVGSMTLTPALARWRGPDAIAFAGTLIVFGVAQQHATPGQAGIAAMVLLAIFTALPYVRPRPGDPENVLIPVMASFTGFAYIEYQLHHVRPSMQGAVAIAFSVAFAGLWLLTREIREQDRSLGQAMFGLSASFAVLAVPFQLHGAFIAAGWALEAFVLLFVSRRRAYGTGITGSMVLYTVAAFVAFGRLERFHPARVIATGDGLSILIVVASLIGAAVMTRGAQRESLRDLSIVTGSVGSLLAVAWLSVEALQAVRRAVPPPSLHQAEAFALTATWALFAATMMVVGIRLRVRAARLAAASLLGIVVLKVALFDVWTLSVAYRTVVFVGLGATLLGCSVMYQRLRALVREPSSTS
ncbi:MAG: DUF2339 domain-containing protein [Actinomycetota bacterium]